MAKKKVLGPVQRKTKMTASGTHRREILYAPWRHAYIKRAEKTEKPAGACVFCGALKAGPGLESLIVFKGKTCSVFLNKYPYNNGHLMVIPHRHTADFLELDDKEFAELHLLLKRAHEALINAYHPQGMNIGMNLGRVAGAGIVDHLHYHLLPRWSGDTNFMPALCGTKVISETLEETYEKLLPLFKSLS